MSKGGVVIKSSDSTAYDTLYDNPYAHNALFRGKDITDYFDSGAMSRAIRDGNFRNIYPGDVIRKTVVIDGKEYKDVKWIVTHLTYFLTEHHVVLSPLDPLFNHRMDPKADMPVKPFMETEMWTDVIPKINAGIIDAFGEDKVLKHKEAIPNTIEDETNQLGYRYRYKWPLFTIVPVTCNLFTYPMVTGNGGTTASFVEYAGVDIQMALFRNARPYAFRANASFWTRTFVGGKCYTAVSGGDCGLPWMNNVTDVLGVRPYFCIH